VTARLLLVTILIGLLAACPSYDASFEDCAVHCTANMQCPVDLTCGDEGLCRASGVTDSCAQVLATFPSCAGLAATCGPNADEDCCSTATPIPGGTFYRSYDVAADGMYPSTSYPATVSPFVLDRFEVTVGRFRKFVEANMGVQTNPPPNGASARRLNGMDDQGGWDASWNASLTADTSALVAALKCDAARQSWTDAPGANETLPINCITWLEARAFCAWDGGFLPTEAEWNYAAAGGNEQRAYPWSSPSSVLTIDCARANYRVDSPPGTACQNGTIGGVQRVGNRSPSGDGRWGQTDLAGNIWEWVLDQYGPYEVPCDNCSKLTPSSPIMRGGHFGDTALFLRDSFRNYAAAQDGTRRYSIGLRCARI